LSKVFSSARVPRQYDQGVFAQLLREIDEQLNSLSEGRIYASYSAYSAAPTTQAHQRGDFVRNTQPTDTSHTAVSSYVVMGWLNVSEGEPGTWVECRALTSDLVLDSSAFTGTDWTDLTDSGATTLHKHDHGGLDGLGDDDHALYLLASDATNRTSFASNWAELTGGGSTTLHSHAGSVAASITVANEATDTTCFPVFVTTATGDQAPKTNTGFGFNSATGALTIGGPLTIGSSQVVTSRQTGWANPSGTPARTTYAIHAGQTITDNYGNLGTLFTQVQTIDDHLKIVSERLAALIIDLTTHGLIGA
jgi:hypothetical protein